MKKQFLLLMALVTFGFASAQDRSSKIIAEVLPKNEVSLDIDKSEKNSKDKADKKAKKAEKKKVVTRTPKRYYINPSGQKTYID